MKTCGKILVTELPLQTSAVNMTRRMLKIVRDEYATACHAVSKIALIPFLFFSPIQLLFHCLGGRCVGYTRVTRLFT